MQEEQFINPYNFFPLGKKRAVTEELAGEKLTGVIEYSLLTKTPLFIPDTNNDKVFPTTVEEHKSYDFFTYTNRVGCTGTYENDRKKPVIPGSEIRGMLRANYEILTNSCMSVLDTDKILSRRSSQTFEAGLLRRNADNTYDLLKATDCLWRTKGPNNPKDEQRWKTEYGGRKCYIQKDFREGQKVYFSYVKRSAERNGRSFLCKPLAMCVSTEKCDKSKTEGYLIKGEASPKTRTEKHCCHIFTLEGAGKIEQKNISIKVLQRSLDKYCQNNSDSYKEYAEQWNKFTMGDGEKANRYFPVYYSKLTKDTEYVMLSPACITREIFKNQLREVAAEYKSCEESPFCPACSLFGTMGKQTVVSSRIRMTDLISSEEDCYDSIITLPELGSPKINNMEFYLQRPCDAVFWTYDYYTDQNGKIHLWDNPRLNGRKFYWHQLNLKIPEDVKHTNRNKTIRPVKKGIKFKGKIFFNGITKRELSELLWLINCGDKKEIGKKNYGYKLGAAKPLGFGSVALDVDVVKIRNIIKNEGGVSYQEEVLEERGQTFWSDECLAREIQEEILPMFRIMTQFDYLKDKKISYPMTKEQLEKSDYVQNGYEWFTQNHYFYDNRKRRKKNISSKREEMRFREYMEAMSPELRSISLEKKEKK